MRHDEKKRRIIITNVYPRNLGKDGCKHMRDDGLRGKNPSVTSSGECAAPCNYYERNECLMINIEEIEAHVDASFDEIMNADNELTLLWEDFFDDKTIVFSYAEKTVALMNANENEAFEGLYIEKFEVLNSYKGNGYGTAIIKEIVSDYNDCYVYPMSENAKIFWEKLGFVEVDDGTGTSIWHLNK